MLPLVVLVVTAPTAFVAAVDHRIANTDLQVAEWWADDLDGDGIAENIAVLCNREQGFYFVQHSKGAGDRNPAVLEAVKEIDGRNDCAATEARPAWDVRQDGRIHESINVHHGNVGYDFAVRGHQLVLVGTDSSGFDHADDHEDSEEETVDFDTLTWTEDHERDGRKTSTHGRVVIAGDHARRPTVLAGATLSATRTDDRVVLHIHADRPVAVRPCAGDVPCAATPAGRGDRDLPLDTNRLDVIVAGTTTVVHVEDGQGDLGYPTTPGPW